MSTVKTNNPKNEDTDNNKEKVTISSVTIGKEINDWLYEKQRTLGLTSRQGVIRHILAQKKDEEQKRSKTNQLLEEIKEELGNDED